MTAVAAAAATPSAAIRPAAKHVWPVVADTRPAAQREAEGEVGAGVPVLVVERNVLEWRLDPRSDARLPEAAYNTRVIVLCQEGYSSSLAADSLRRLGVRRATDVIGGFAAWREAGLPVCAPPAG